jgi:hypothetical protein
MPHGVLDRSGVLAKPENIIVRMPAPANDLRGIHASLISAACFEQ